MTGRSASAGGIVVVTVLVMLSRTPILGAGADSPSAPSAEASATTDRVADVANSTSANDTTTRLQREARTTMKPVHQVLGTPAPTPRTTTSTTSPKRAVATALFRGQTAVAFTTPKVMIVFGRSMDTNTRNTSVVGDPLGHDGDLPTSYGTRTRTRVQLEHELQDRLSAVPEEPSRELLPPYGDHGDQGDQGGHGEGVDARNVQLYHYSGGSNVVYQTASSRPQQPQQDDPGYDYTAPQRTDSATQQDGGYRYPDPQRDDPGRGYNYPKPQQDDPGRGYNYPKPQQDDPKPAAGYNYPKPQQDDPKPAVGYNYPKPQQDDPKPAAGYNYPKPQQDDPKPAVGYNYPKPQQDDPKPVAGYSYPKPQQDDPGQGHNYPKPQHPLREPEDTTPSTSLWKPMFGYPSTVSDEYLPPKQQLPLEDQPRPSYGSPLRDEIRTTVSYYLFSPPPLRDEVTTTSRPLDQSYVPPKPPAPQDDLPYSYVPPRPPPLRDEPPAPALAYLPPSHVNDVAPAAAPPNKLTDAYLPPSRPPKPTTQAPLREELPADSYLPAKEEVLDDPPSNSYVPPKRPLADGYLPPKQPLRDDVPVAYLPPATTRKYIPLQRPQADALTPTYPEYLPPAPAQSDAVPLPQPAKEYLPALPQQDPVPPTPTQPASSWSSWSSWSQYPPLPLPLNDVGTEDADDIHSARSARPRHLGAVLRSGTPDEHGIKVTDMSCLRTASRARFTATITSPSFVAWPPVLEGVAGSASPGCRVIADPADPHHRFLVDLSNPDLTRCGVKGCSADGEGRLCVHVLLPSLPGLRLAGDPQLLLQCALQPATGSQLQQVRVAAAKPVGGAGRSAGGVGGQAVHAGGERAQLHAQLQLFRRGAGGEFSRQLQPGGTTHLGDELQLRAVVRRGDGWQSSRLSDVVIRRPGSGSGSGASEAVHIVSADGCNNPDMKLVCPRSQAWLAGEPLVTLLGMRVFMFRGMQDGDQLLVSARVVACLDRADCKVDARSCETGGRVRRSSPSGTARAANATTVFEDSVAFSVHFSGNGTDRDFPLRESRSSASLLSASSPSLALAVLLAAASTHRLRLS